MVPMSGLFDVFYGHSLELNRLALLSRDKGGIPFVSRKMGDNGISAYVAPIEGVKPSPAGLLTCALGGNGVMSTFLQEEPFYSGRDMALLRPRNKMTKQQLLFYCFCLVSNRHRFSYGRQANRTLKNILVPALEELPAYVSQADTTCYEGCDKAALLQPPDDLMTLEWKCFTLGSLFEVVKGQRLTKANMRPGDLPYIGASDASNGVTARIGQESIYQGNTLTVSYDGSIAEAFYQPDAYWASDAVNVLRPKGFELTPSVALFICSLIRLEKYRFNYGRKWHLERMREAEIKLPATKNGEPNWAFMDRYISALPFSSQIGSVAEKGKSDRSSKPANKVCAAEPAVACRHQVFHSAQVMNKPDRLGP